MRTPTKLLLALTACVMLNGCPKVKSVQGEALVKQGALSWSGAYSKLVPVTPGMNLQSGETVTVRPGASVTISIAGNDGSTCELTYTTSFIVPPEPLDCEKQKEEDDQQQDDRDDQQQDDQDDQQQDQQQSQDQQQDPQQSQDPGGQQSQSATQDLAPQAGQAQDSLPGNGTTPPATTSSAVASEGMSTLQIALVTTASIVAAKTAYDELKDDDKPISR